MPKAAKKRKVNGLDVRSKTNEYLEKISSTLDALESSSASDIEGLVADASSSLLGMKTLQRKILDKILATQKQLDVQRESRDSQELKLQNLKYRNVLNRHSIETSQQLETSQLVQLCRSELPAEEKETDSDAMNDESVIKAFLGADPHDPVQHAVIVDKLNQQVRSRKKLEAELRRCQSKASSLKKSLASKRKLLQELPQKLQQMERASLPFQEFFKESMNASQRLGTERQKNLDLANSLPKALYTLYYQFQSCLDAMETSGELSNESSHRPTVEVSKESTTVVFKIPIPNISDRPTGTATGFGGGPKLAIISFGHNSVLDVVVAKCSKDHDMDTLIDELFPGDTGGWLEDSDETSDSSKDNQPAGLPYGWCNYLAGVRLANEVQESRSDLRKSATVVIRKLIQRVRGQASLNWILHALSRKSNPIPVHPDMKSRFPMKDTQVKLTSWEKEDAGDGTTSLDRDCCYIVTLKRKSSSISVRVLIKSTVYPSVPPEWDLNPGDTGDDSLDRPSTLYNEGLSTLQHHINHDVDQLVLPQDETTYDWILSHQLAELAMKWEDYLTGQDSVAK